MLTAVDIPHDSRRNRDGGGFPVVGGEAGAVVGGVTGVVAGGDAGDPPAGGAAGPLTGEVIPVDVPVDGGAVVPVEGEVVGEDPDPVEPGIWEERDEPGSIPDPQPVRTVPATAITNTLIP